MKSTCVRSAAVLMLLVPLILSGPPTYAQQVSEAPRPGFQTEPHYIVGYSVNAPMQLIGFSVLGLDPRFNGWGLYADAKFALDSPADEGPLSDSTIEQIETQFGDREIDDESVWTSFNVALVRAITNALAVYAGAGYSHEKVYRRYFDDSRERGEFGYYWVTDDAETGGRVNFLVGAWFHVIPPLVLQFGVESAPRGFTVGIGYTLPFGR